MNNIWRVIIDIDSGRNLGNRPKGTIMSKKQIDEYYNLDVNVAYHTGIFEPYEEMKVRDILPKDKLNSWMIAGDNTYLEGEDAKWAKDDPDNPSDRDREVEKLDVQDGVNAFLINNSYHWGRKQGWIEHCFPEEFSSNKFKVGDKVEILNSDYLYDKPKKLHERLSDYYLESKDEEGLGLNNYIPSSGDKGEIVEIIDDVYIVVYNPVGIGHNGKISAIGFKESSLKLIEEEIEVGDLVICNSVHTGNKEGSASTGWSSNMIFKVKSIDDHKERGKIYFGGKNGNGVWEQDCKKFVEWKYARCIKTGDTAEYTTGKIYPVKENEDNTLGGGIKTLLDDKGSTTNGWTRKYFEEATQEEWEEQENNKPKSRRKSNPVPVKSNSKLELAKKLYPIGTKAYWNRKEEWYEIINEPYEDGNDIIAEGRKYDGEWEYFLIYDFNDGTWAKKIVELKPKIEEKQMKTRSAEDLL